MTSINDFSKFFLDIEDENIIFSDFYYDTSDPSVRICDAELIQPHCPFCNSSMLIHNGHYVSNVKYITADASKPVIIKLRKQRVLCKSCHKRSMAKTNLVDKNCFISNASKRKVLAALTEDRSMTSIAREHCLSVNTVLRILTSCSSKFCNDYDQLPEHLAFDEFRGVGKKLHFICLDGDTHKITQILPVRYKSTILDYFNKFSPQARNMVKTVTMDLNCYYPLIARELFPNAEIVIDRFHMIQMLNRAFNSCRVQVMKQFKKSSRQYRFLKAHWKLYLKNYDDLEKTKPLYRPYIKDNLTQEHIVLNGLECDKVLENTYWLMQNFSEAMRNKDIISARNIIFSSQAISSMAKTTLNTFKKNITAVLNGISSPYSNGCLEGVNRKIKQICRTAYGYRNFRNLLTRIRLQENRIKQKEPNYRMVA